MSLVNGLIEGVRQKFKAQPSDEMINGTLLEVIQLMSLALEASPCHQEQMLGMKCRRDQSNKCVRCRTQAMVREKLVGILE